MKTHVLAVFLSLVGALASAYALGLSEAAFWDLAVVKESWSCYPAPFEWFQICPRAVAGDGIWLFNLISAILLLASVVSLVRFLRWRE
jgi:hypothetical protein